MNSQIKKNGNSKVIIIPSAIIKTLGLSEKDNLSIKVPDDKIILTKANTFNPKSLKELFDNYNDRYNAEIIFDDAKGREVW